MSRQIRIIIALNCQMPLGKKRESSQVESTNRIFSVPSKTCVLSTKYLNILNSRKNYQKFMFRLINFKAIKLSFSLVQMQIGTDKEPNPAQHRIFMFL